ncbi:integrating conjugative element protein [Salinicola sp. MH3R3-1]|uniref:TIGR03758 family integrating conjugative element protein n=1 Tax=Salinicola sp. MH3R3-1 TaxID=1928762 RepID=UPI00094E4BFC|nr:TIGR03758 family integrating conjugative element protein [Salinicola sp. MH3R3-1]OLO06718.1 integrating conjugative element protein [Salinicola sp. MH3R3-1]
MEAFEAGAGLGGQELSWLIAGVGCSAAMLLVIWILMSAYRGWVRGRVDGDILSAVALKSLVLVLLFFWLFLS